MKQRDAKHHFSGIKGSFENHQAKTGHFFLFKILWFLMTLQRQSQMSHNIVIMILGHDIWHKMMPLIELFYVNQNKMRNHFSSFEGSFENHQAKTGHFGQNFVIFDDSASVKTESNEL